MCRSCHSVTAVRYRIQAVQRLPQFCQRGLLLQFRRPLYAKQPNSSSHIAQCPPHNRTMQFLAERSCVMHGFKGHGDQCALAVALEAEPKCYMQIFSQRAFNSHAHASDLLRNGGRVTCSLCRPGDYICHGYACVQGNCDRLLSELVRRSRRSQVEAQRQRDQGVPDLPLNTNVSGCPVPSAYYHCLDPDLEKHRLKNTFSAGPMSL
eukprot:TRINITY_DN5327_c0_g1_i2.p1 TRINITY_DN5327_c0_g1~~TRINITY_DN5327_c0_g1_i2.p1  ORF type:complete len:207 (+),score=5.64 TRINITY_DN5327_c0_g1_i2:264-884(+)